MIYDSPDAIYGHPAPQYLQVPSQHYQHMGVVQALAMQQPHEQIRYGEHIPQPQRVTQVTAGSFGAQGYGAAPAPPQVYHMGPQALSSGQQSYASSMHGFAQQAPTRMQANAHPQAMGSGGMMYPQPVVPPPPPAVTPSQVVIASSAVTGRMNYSEFPEFKCTPGLMAYMQFYRKWVTAYHSNKHFLEGNPGLQHQVLMSTLKTTQAQQFLATHTERLISLCSYPEIGPLLRSSTGKQSARSMGLQFAELERLKTQGCVVEPPRVQAPEQSPSKAPSSLPAHLVAAIHSTYKEDHSPGEKYPFIWAFLAIVEEEMCKPTPAEIKVWENNMFMGRSNIFDEVSSTETPQAFLDRIINTYAEFTRFAALQFNRSTRMDCLEVFLSGIPEDLSEEGNQVLQKINVDRTPLAEQLLAVAAGVTNLYSYQTWRSARKIVNGTTLETRRTNAPFPSQTSPRPDAPTGQRLPYGRYRKQAQNAALSLLASAGYDVQQLTEIPPPEAISAAGQASVPYPATIHPPRGGPPRDNRDKGRQGRPDRQPERQPNKGVDRQSEHPPGNRDARASGQPPPPQGKLCHYCKALGKRHDDHFTSQCRFKDLAVQLLQEADKSGRLPAKPSNQVVAPPPGPPPSKLAESPPRPSSHVSSAVLSTRSGRQGKEVRIPIPVIEESDSETEDEDRSGYAPRRVAFVSSACSLLLQTWQDKGPKPSANQGVEVDGSLDLFPALACSGVLTRSSAIGALSAQGKFPVASMAAPFGQGSLPCAQGDTPLFPFGQGSPCAQGNNTLAPVGQGLMMPLAQGALPMLQPSTPPPDALKGAAFTGHTMFTPQSLATLEPFQPLLAELVELKHVTEGNAQNSVVEAKLTSLGIEIARTVAGLCNKNVPSVSAGAVAETYTRDTRKIYPQSFSPVEKRGPEAAQNPSVQQKEKGLPATLSSEPPQASPEPSKPELIISDPSAASIDSRRASASQVDKSQVQSPLIKTRPKSFEIDESKLGPSLREWEFDYLHDQSKDVGNISQNKQLITLSSDAIPSSLPQVSVRELIDRYLLDLSGNLSYFAPKSQVGLLHGGDKHSDPKTMLDWGSNVYLVDDKFCRENGIPIFPTSIRLATSNAASTRLVGITPVITVSYGTAPDVFCTEHAFLVVPHVKNGPFRILIGNRDAMIHGGVHDMGAHTLSYRTKWSTMGLKSPMVSFPLISRRP